jgi:3-oxoacyl-[acyl-carrier-protein] synthase II
MRKEQIVLSSIGSVSALGCNRKDILSTLQMGICNPKWKEINNEKIPVFPIHPNGELALGKLLEEYPKYKRSDRTAQLAILAAEICFDSLPQSNNHEWVINAGSSRGATTVWENAYQTFIEQKSVPVKSSPLTTLGNISTHVAQHQKLNGFLIDHSITCSSGLQAMANGYAWLKSGLTNHFLAVGTEAPLTEFTIAQMKVLGIYSKEGDHYPCKPCANNDDQSNTFVLGEGAVAIALVNKKELDAGDIVLAGMGTASESIPNHTSITPYGEAFRMSMLKAIENAGITPQEIQLVIPHSPGTYQGDKAEYNALESLFNLDRTQVYNHKYLTGHTLGASGLLGVELGYYFLKENLDLQFPYPSLYTTKKIQEPTYVLINSMGFGGNAVSIILKKI